MRGLLPVSSAMLCPLRCPASGHCLPPPIQRECRPLVGTTKSRPCRHGESAASPAPGCRHTGRAGQRPAAFQSGTTHAGAGPGDRCGGTAAGVFADRWSALRGARPAATGSPPIAGVFADRWSALQEAGPAGTGSPPRRRHRGVGTPVEPGNARLPFNPGPHMPGQVRGIVAVARRPVCLPTAGRHYRKPALPARGVRRVAGTGVSAHR